jgi:hypothetical protein
VCEHCPERGSLCPNCGADPCYHLCPNSSAYYSPEQERADEPFYGDDDHRERYAATAESSQYADYPEIPEEFKRPEGVRLEGMWQGTVTNDDDIPF